MLVVWKLDRLGRNLTHLVNTVQSLCARGVGRRVLTGQGAQIDTQRRLRAVGVLPCNRRCGTLNLLGSRQVGALEYGH